MKAVRWGFAALAFACTVALALHTAAVGARNAERRLRLQRLEEVVWAVRAQRERLRAEWVLRTQPQRLQRLVLERLGPPGAEE